MKKIVSLVLAVVFAAAVFAGCAEKAEMQKIDPVKVTSVQNSANNTELDREAAVKAYNEANVGNKIEEGDNSTKSGQPVLFVTADGVVAVFVTGENKFVVSSDMFDYDFEIESAELYKMVK